MSVGPELSTAHRKSPNSSFWDESWLFWRSRCRSRLLVSLSFFLCGLRVYVPPALVLLKPYFHYFSQCRDETPDMWQFTWGVCGGRENSLWLLVWGSGKDTVTRMVCGEGTGRMGQLVQWTKKPRQSRKQTIPSPLITPNDPFLFLQQCPSPLRFYNLSKQCHPLGNKFLSTSNHNKP